MSEYEIDEARMRLPAPMVDLSANALEAPLPEGGLMRVYVARHPRSGSDLSAQVRERLVDLRRKLPEFAAEAEAPLQIEGRAAIESRFTYRDGKTPVYQRMVAFFVHNKLVMLGIVGPTSAKDLADRTFDAILKSLAIEDRSAPH